MTVNSISDSSKSTMNLGVVTINNKNYFAVLHYRKDGNPREITSTMLKAQAVYAGLFQNVIAGYNREDIPLQVSDSGFVLENTTISHEDMQTALVWNKFIMALENPTLVSELDGATVELIDIEEFKNVKLNKIYQAFIDREEDSSKTVTLGFHEKRCLKCLGFTKLASCEFDDDEHSRLGMILRSVKKRTKNNNNNNNY